MERKSTLSSDGFKLSQILDSLSLKDLLDFKADGRLKIDEKKELFPVCSCDECGKSAEYVLVTVHVIHVDDLVVRVGFRCGDCL